MAAEQTEDSIQLRLFRGPVDSLSLHEITDYELDLLEQGMADSKPIGFSIMILLASLFGVVVLPTIELDIGLLFFAIVLLIISGLGISAVMFVVWKRSCSRSKRLYEKIRARVPTESMRKSDGRTQAPNIPATMNG